MLVLTRKIGEQVVIDGGILLTVLKVNRNRVKLGIKGPVDVSIHRGELHKRIGDRTAATTKPVVTRTSL